MGISSKNIKFKYNYNANPEKCIIRFWVRLEILAVGPKVGSTEDLITESDKWHAAAYEHFDFTAMLNYISFYMIFQKKKSPSDLGFPVIRACGLAASANAQSRRHPFEPEVLNRCILASIPLKLIFFK